MSGKTVELTEKDRVIIAALLDLAESKFENHGCNDLPRFIKDSMSFESWEELVPKIQERVGELGEYPSCPANIQDTMLMSYYSHLLREGTAHEGVEF